MIPDLEAPPCYACFVAVILYGLRNYGRVDAHAGEYAQTRFFHLWFAPLFPTGSSWVTGPRADGTNAHAIKLEPRSVAAGYLRVWGPLVAIGNLGAGATAGATGAGAAHWIVAAIATLLTAWSWSFRNLRGAAAIRRSDFNLVAFGTRCEPKRLLAPHRLAVKRALDRRWTERAPSRSPNEVAAHGAADTAEAVLAYGLLRLSAIERGRAGASDGADADRLLAGHHEAPATDDGPYRAGVSAPLDPATGPGLAELVQQRAAAATVGAVAAPAHSYERGRLRRRSRQQFAGLVVLTLAAFGGVLAFAMSLRPTLAVGLAELQSMHPPLTRRVSLTCDAIDAPRWTETDRHGEPTARIAMCHLGKWLLPLKLGVDGAVPRTVVTGKLYEVDDRHAWVRDGLREDVQTDAKSLDVYVDTTRGDSDRVAGVFGLALAIGTPVLWVLWFRARRRRILAERATTTSS